MQDSICKLEPYDGRKDADARSYSQPSFDVIRIPSMFQVTVPESFRLRYIDSGNLLPLKFSECIICRLAC